MDAESYPRLGSPATNEIPAAASPSCFPGDGRHEEQSPKNFPTPLNKAAADTIPQ